MSTVTCEITKQHVYKYENAGYTCVHCGKTVEYDMMNRDFK
jgi:DNA-directed RNA polymerase subunit RPC12/RpoP